MSYRLIDANSITFNSDGFITADNIIKMPCIYADLPNGMDGEHYVLEQEPCEDAISREDALMALTGEWTEPTDEIIHRFIKRIKKLPTVNPQPRTGHWSRKTKVDAYDIAGVKTWGIKCQCDRCDFKTIVVEDFGYYKYCPNCGARMVGNGDKE